MIEEDPNFFKSLMPSQSRGRRRECCAQPVVFMRLTPLIAGYV
jgi:hypothetical protein